MFLETVLLQLLGTLFPSSSISSSSLSVFVTSADCGQWPWSCLFRSSAVNGVVAGVSALSQKQQQKQQAKIRSLNQLMNNQPKKAQQQQLAKNMNMLPRHG